MSELKKVTIQSVLNFLTGSYGDIDVYIKEDPKLVAKCITYQLGRNYHRKNMCESIIKLINIADPQYRSIGWALLQKMKLSHLLEIQNLLTNTLNSRKLRHALVTKIANSSIRDIFYAYFISPSSFRNMFEKMFLPKDTIGDHEIKNKSYAKAVELSTMPMHEVVETLENKIDLFTTYRLPLETAMQFFKTEEEALQLSEVLENDTFFRHGRWFKEIIGNDRFEEIALEKVQTIQNPIYFLSQKDHLLETESMTDTILEKIQELAKKQMNELLKTHKIERLALIVDTSPSMETAITITEKLYHGFQMDFTDIIEFNSMAYAIKPHDIANLRTRGMTSCGSSIMLLSRRVISREMKNIPQAIIMVTDLEENTSPYLSDTLPLLKELGSPPLVVIDCGRKPEEWLDLHDPLSDYPHSRIKAQAFHPSLIQEIIRSVVQSASIMVKEKTVTDIVKSRKPIDELVAETEIPIRPKYTLHKGFLERLLTREKGIKELEEVVKYKNHESIQHKIERIMKHTTKITLKRLSEILGIHESVIVSHIKNVEGIFRQGDEIMFSPSAKADKIVGTYWGVPCDKCGYVNDPSDRICYYCSSDL